ncbi:MAG TPA: hypothetical protein VFU17_08585, partial [Candidatus Limnocylindrales bacterium]|nr:hypothetical protein [Candidatus Limnocylindrales bacterium]
EDDPPSVEWPLARRASAEAERTLDVGGTVRAVQVELGNRRSTAFEGCRHWEVELPGRDLRDQHRLVVASLAGTIGVDRNGDEEIATRTRPIPAPRNGTPERLSEAPFAGVLELVQRPAYGTGERRAPLQLQQRLGDVRREAERRAGREMEPGVEGGFAIRAKGRSLVAAADTAGRQREIEGSVEEVAHRLIVGVRASLAVTR